MGRTRVYSDEMVYSAIVKFIDENRYPPSVRELCKIVSNASTSTIHARLKSLQYRGYIKFNSGARRTIQINDTSDVVRVVRCKDCTHFGMASCNANLMSCAPRLDDFCSWGERRTNEN